MTDATFEPIFRPASESFEEQARQFPNTTAVITSGTSLSYKELNDRANRIAHTLIENGLEAEDTVLILLPRIADYYAANIGVLKSGAAFVPADIHWPKERLSFVCDDAKCKCIISSHDVISEIGEDPFLKKKTLYIDDAYSHPKRENPNVKISAHDLAYIIYTSGSTGEPKGVMIEHSNLSHFLDTHPANRETSILAKKIRTNLATTPLSFDVAVMDEFIPLTNGKTVFLADEQEIRSPESIKDIIVTHNVNATVSTPSYLSTLLSHPNMEKAMRQIDIVDIGAETFPPSLFDRLKKANPDMVVLNGYGPTETTISCTMKVIDSSKAISIGTPNGNTQCFIVDEHCDEVATGKIGELLICGPSVGRGYRNRPELTEKSFITFRGLRAYKSGDYACINEKSEIEFHGRKDHQVKLKGLRIELGEIESAFLKHSQISECAAKVVKQQICLYYVLKKRASLSKADILAFAQKALPRYMTPDRFMELEEMPLLPSQKLDRNALPEPESTSNFKEPETPLQKQILSLISSIKQDASIGSIGTETDLVEAGFTSLDFIELIGKIVSEFSVGITFKDLMQNRTILQIESFLSDKRISPKQTSQCTALPQRIPAQIHQSIYFSQWATTEAPDTMIPVLLEMSKSIEKNRLKQAIRDALTIHDSIFTSFEYDEITETLYQIPPDTTALPEIEIPCESIKDIDLPILEKQLVSYVIHPGSPQLFEIRLYESETKIYLFMTFVHAISDAESIRILIEDIISAYENKSLESEKKSILTFSNEIFNDKANKDPLEEKQDFLKRLESIDKWTHIPEKDNPVGVQRDTLFKPLTAKPSDLEIISNRLNTSENIIFMAITALLLSIESKSNNVCFLTAFSGRNDDKLMRSFGLFSTVLPLHLSIKPEQTFKELLQETKEQYFSCISESYTPLEILIEKFPRCIDYIFVFQQKDEDFFLNGEKIITHWLENEVTVENSEFQQRMSKMDNSDSERIYFIVHPESPQYMLELYYLTSLFEQPLIERMYKNADKILLEIIRTNGNISIADLYKCNRN